ncbi:endonuclease/exonuclease/phosphatase family protein [Rhizobium sp. L1K21]|uniref:endonuclease/exonuclease/phosphatase family protein n=1 Tax=Rhizobium sp. L1K21 TaxID=2954933 RepID=UPI00209205A5|nr:endonuclease/exonuclease/phosphatase family protein [Rhizobium sp. L1K21]MCO6187797.1 endonuclease/exonuclease/phosphatase family protein [Rhizobium sp. L1K21]
MARKIRILTYNVHSCIGTDRKIDPARVADVIAAYEPDIVGLQELDMNRQRSGSVDQADIIAALLKMKTFSHPTIHTAAEKFGDAILTALPMEVKKVGILRSIREPRGVAWVEVDVDGQPLQVINTHLGVLRRERMPQITTLLGNAWLDHPDCRGKPTVLMGDFNAIPASPGYRQIARQMRDIWQDVSGKPAPTFHSRYRVFRLDHIFLSGGVRGVSAQIPSTPLTRTASDHLPLVGEIELPERA